MSMESWKAKYYRKPAIRAAKKGVKAALKHSIRKWKGLGFKRMDEHGVAKPLPGGRSNIVYAIASDVYNEVDHFDVNADSCALCILDDQADGDCSSCAIPLSGSAACGYLGSPYQIWLETGNNKPMVKALKHALWEVKAGRIE